MLKTLETTTKKVSNSRRNIENFTSSVIHPRWIWKSETIHASHLFIYNCRYEASNTSDKKHAPKIKKKWSHSATSVKSTHNQFYMLDRTTSSQSSPLKKPFAVIERIHSKKTVTNCCKNFHHLRQHNQVKIMTPTVYIGNIQIYHFEYFFLC